MNRMRRGSRRSDNGLDGRSGAQFSWHGVSVESSTSDGDELDTMLDFVSAMSPADRALVGTIYCDSAAGHCSVHLRRGSPGVASKIVCTCASVLYASLGSVRSLTVVSATSTDAWGSLLRGRLR